MSAESDKIRREWKISDAIRDRGLATPEDIIRYDDITYGDSVAEQKLDVYRPREQAGKKLPVIISVHGGGWVYGDKELYQYYCMSLAQHGFAVINFTYRLAPEHKFPAQLEDTNQVVYWMMEHAEAYGFDTTHVFTVGDSAGGHLSGLYALICTNPAYAAKYDMKPPKGFAPTAIALNCGVYHITMEARTDHEKQTLTLMTDLLPGQVTPETLAEIHIAPYITEDFPPTFVMTATGDFLIAQPQILTKKLTEKNVPFISRLYGDARHELGHVFHCNMHLPEAALCNTEECSFFKEFIRA